MIEIHRTLARRTLQLVCEGSEDDVKRYQNNILRFLVPMLIAIRHSVQMHSVTRDVSGAFTWTNTCLNIGNHVCCKNTGDAGQKSKRRLHFRYERLSNYLLREDVFLNLPAGY